MSIYIVIGIVILAIICIYFVMQKKKAKELMDGKERKQPTEQEMKEMQKRLQEILAYDLKDEEAISKQLPNMTTQEMAKYADKITLKNINDTKFLDGLVPADLIDKMKKAPFDDQKARRFLLSPTIFGNLAYVSTHSNEPYSSRANEGLAFLKSKL